MAGESKDALLESLRRRIDDARVLDAIAAVPREVFVPRGLRGRAWEDAALPIAAGQTISQPLVVAHMCALLDIVPGDRILDVGTGSGYHAAVLAALGAEVWSIERHAQLSREAARALDIAGQADRVHLLVGDGALGHPEAAPYDAINVAAAASGRVPRALVEQLRLGGRLVLPVDERLVVVDRESQDRVVERDAGAVRFVPLIGG